jgi:nucleoside-diphosphate-sugar epimerase
MSTSRLPRTHQHVPRGLRRLAAYLKSLVLLVFAAFSSFELRFDGAVPARYLHAMKIAICIWATVKMAALIAGSVMRQKGRHTSIYEATRIIAANTLGSLVAAVAIFILLGTWAVPHSIYILEWILSCFLMLGARLATRVIMTAIRNRRGEATRTRTFIYGAGAAGLALLWELRQNPSLAIEVVGLIDDNPHTVGLIFDGKPVLGTGEELAKLARKHRVARVLIAIPSATALQRARIVRLVTDACLDYKMVPGLGDLILDKGLSDPIQNGNGRFHPASEAIAPVLLIGGAGYIGSALLPKLLADGYRVRLLDAFLYGDEPIAAWKHKPNLEIVKADFRRVDVVVRAMQGVQAVIHLGAIVGDPACALDEELTIETNLLATRMIAEVTKGEGIERFIFASSCSVYGATDDFLNEDSMLHPVSLYARSKIACENVLLGMKSDTFRPVLLRFGTIFGLSGRTRFDLVVNLLTAKAVVDRTITVFGSDQWRPFLHVDDAALAVHRVLKAPDDALTDTVFNVGSNGQNRTLGDVGRLIRRMVPTAELQILDNGNIDRRNYRVNFSRIRRCLDYAPAWTLQDGISQVIEAIESGQIKDYRSPLYSNVRFLSEEIGPESLRFAQERWARNVLEVSDNNGMVSAT